MNHSLSKSFADCIAQALTTLCTMIITRLLSPLLYNENLPPLIVYVPLCHITIRPRRGVCPRHTGTSVPSATDALTLFRLGSHLLLLSVVSPSDHGLARQARAGYKDSVWIRIIY